MDVAKRKKAGRARRIHLGRRTGTKRSGARNNDMTRILDQSGTMLTAYVEVTLCGIVLAIPKLRNPISVQDSAMMKSRAIEVKRF